MNMEQPVFNPHDEKFKKVADLPKEEQEKFVDIEGGFIIIEASKYNEDKEKFASSLNSQIEYANSQRGILDKLLGRNKDERKYDKDQLIEEEAHDENYEYKQEQDRQARLDTMSPEEKENMRKRMEESEKEQRGDLEAILSGDEIMIPCRNFVRPEYNFIRSMNSMDSRSVVMADVFKLLDIPREKLAEIYIEGSFAPGGKQLLADLLKKKINFYYSPEQNMVISDSKETFEPKI
jgi:hypothetical protein